MSSEPGRKIDRYVIEAELGSGAMGKVYRAHDTRLRRLVALKVLEASSMIGADDAIESALREARAAAAIQHPNVTAVFDAGREDDVSYVVMELVPGTPLHEFIGKGTADLRSRVRWLVDIALALSAAHGLGVVHRDIKPQNVIVRDDGLVKVLDFGIARLPRSVGPDAAYENDLATLSGRGGLMGTPAYMAPEQIRGMDVDHRTDQFSWGVVAYELLVGALPWPKTSSPFELFTAILRDPPAPFPATEEIPPEIVAVVTRALSKSPNDRFPAMAEVAALLAPFAASSLTRIGAPPESAASLRPRSTPSDPGPGPASAERLVSPSQVSASSERITPPPQVSASSERITPPPYATASSERFAPPQQMSKLFHELGDHMSEPTATLPAGPAGAEPQRFRRPEFGAPIDLDAHLALLPPDATVKGMFFLDLLRMGTLVRSAFELATLASIPQRRYMAFRDYPMSEALRLTIAVARATQRGLPLGEAIRRIGHRAFETVLGTHIGKTLFGALGSDVDLLLTHGPRAYGLLINIGKVTGRKESTNRYVFEARKLPAFLETYHVGAIEGVLKHCGARGRVRVAMESLSEADFEVELL